MEIRDHSSIAIDGDGRDFAREERIQLLIPFLLWWFFAKIDEFVLGGMILGRG
jgi:hypothetical protein